MNPSKSANLALARRYWEGQRILGTASERETVEVALDMIVFRWELIKGAQVLAEVQIDSIR
jgi:hypothetical protein